MFAVGADGPGIVAGITGALFGAGANLLDCSMTILSGHFAVVLVLDADAGRDAIEAALEPVARRFDLAVTVRTIAPARAARPRTPPVDVVAVDVVAENAVPVRVVPVHVVPVHVVSVHGADRPGIVARVTAVLADRGANIVGLSTRRVCADAADGTDDDDAAAVYVMTLEVVLSATIDAATLATDLARLGDDLGIDLHVHAVDADIL